jgi:hypothetical protein
MRAISRDGMISTVADTCGYQPCTTSSVPYPPSATIVKIE